MDFKVDSGGSPNGRKIFTAKTPSVKPTQPNISSDSVTDASVYANSNQDTQKTYRNGQKPNAQTSPAVANSTSKITLEKTFREETADKTQNQIFYNISSETQAFIDQIETHRGDGGAVKRYFAALGSDKTAELISNAATPSGYSNFLRLSSGNDEAAEQFTRNMTVLRDVFDTLQTSGNFSQTDLNNLVKSLQKTVFNPSVAIDIFGQVSSEVQESFIRSAIANGDETLAAAAAYVMAQMSIGKQSQLLGKLSPDELNKFIRRAMAGQTETLDLKNYLKTGMGDRSITLGGIQAILEIANRKTVYYHAQTGGPEITPELRNRIFNAIVNALNNPQTFEKFKVNPAFKDALFKLFKRTSKDLAAAQSLE